MAKPCPLGIVVAFSFLASFLPADGGAAGGKPYIRPPPARMVLTANTNPKSYPQQVHISMAGAEDHMLISWLTDDKSSPSLVEYGETSGSYDRSATGNSTSYRYFFYESGKIHSAVIGPLDPDTLYYYRCGGAGAEYAFKTPPASLPIEFVVVGDLGQTEWTRSTLEHVSGSPYDVLLLPGDLSYADTQQPLWDSFGRLVEPHASRRPWMVTEGNHEVESFLFFVPPFEAYNARWRMIGGGGVESGSNLYYSFSAAGGTAHVVMLGSYADYGDGSDQMRWLAADLAAVDRRRTPWLVAVLHAPWYNTNEAHQGEGEGMRSTMEEMLYAARVDVVFAGHVHAYERFTRIYNNEVNPCGPIYITIGDGGNREGLALNFDKNNKNAKLSLFREASFGHGRLRIVDEKRARWTWYRNNDADTVVADEVLFESLSASTVVCDPQASSHHAKDEL